MRTARVTQARAVLVRLEHTVAASLPTSSPPTYRLSDYPVQYVRGVGPRKAEALDRIGIRTVEDAVWTLPWRYEDRSQLRSISSLVPGESAMIEGQVERTGLKVTTYQRRKLVEVVVADRTGRTCKSKIRSSRFLRTPLTLLHPPSPHPPLHPPTPAAPRRGLFPWAT
jgi:hypothetical protein